MDENKKKTKFLKDLDRVRKQISEIEEVELERTKKEQALKSEKLFLINLLEEMPMGILSVNVQGVINSMNSAAIKKLGIDPDQSTEKIDIWNFPVFVNSGLSKGIRKCLDSQRESSDESLYKDEKGKEHYFKNTFTPLFNKDGSISGVMTIIEDVTEKKEGDLELRQKLGYEKFMSRILSRLVKIQDLKKALSSILKDIGIKFNADRTGLFFFDEQKHCISCAYEWNSKEADSQIDSRRNIPLDEFQWMIEKFKDRESIQIKTNSEMDKAQQYLKKYFMSVSTLSFLAVPIFSSNRLTGALGIEWISKQGNWSESDISLLNEVSNNLGYFIGEKKADEAKIKANNRFCMLAQAGFEAIVILKDQKIIDGNHAASSLFEYKPSEYMGKDLSIFFDSNEKKTIEDHINNSKSQPLESMGIKKSGEVIPVEILTKAIFDENDQMQVLGIRDISGRERISADMKERYETLKEIMDDTVKALATSVELKDPYTAGHMQRVTRLACAIAEEMGLSKKRIQGLRVAASIHDVGKISIPAEILSKPEELTKAERMIVESHPETGYDILKNIEFPWPIADIVLQHHERMNGSGYPSGLSRDKILMEARIIGVADIVEALTSNRPHRSAQETESSIKELKKNKRSLYDPDVVEACLKIITKRSFSFQTFSLGDI